jgi:hypothetical protein
MNFFRHFVGRCGSPQQCRKIMKIFLVLQGVAVPHKSAKSNENFPRFTGCGGSAQECRK